MAPKIKINREEIINAALDLIRSGGEGEVNARNLAAALNCSTQPIFSNFASMDALEVAVLEEAYKLYLKFLSDNAESGRYPKYKAFGMGYIRFAKEEKELFKLIFMRDMRDSKPKKGADFKESVRLIAEENGITYERAELMHLEMWICVHGIATMQATAFLPLDDELVSVILTDIYQGVRAKHIAEEK